MAQALSLRPAPTPQSFPDDISEALSVSSHTQDRGSTENLWDTCDRQHSRHFSQQAPNHPDAGSCDQGEISAPRTFCKRAQPDTAFEQLSIHPAKVAATCNSGQGPSSSVVSSLSTRLMGSYDMRHSQTQFFTKPSEGTNNDGYDNDNHDLILYLGMVFESQNARYTVKGILGQGTFGQVVECRSDVAPDVPVAVKVIKNQAAFYHQARVEVGVLKYLNTQSDPDNTHHIVRMKDYFNYKHHLCLVFELLSLNLYELIKHNNFRGLSMNLLRVFISQILDALTVLRHSNIIHCDLKPENVLLKSLDNGDIKVIDFGSACFENRTMYSYIQSRFYRSPEVVLGYKYDVAVDMWSLGCMAAELFLGLPLFPGASEHDLLVRIVEMLGPPPDWLLQKATNTSKFFRDLGPSPVDGHGIFGDSLGSSQFAMRSQAEFEALHGQQAPAGKRYFHHTKLPDIIGAYPYKNGLSDSETRKEKRLREAFLDFLLGVLDLSPETRWSPQQAQQHPFVTGMPFTGPYQPAPDPREPFSSPTPAPITDNPYNGTTSLWPQPVPAGQPMVASSPEFHAQAHAFAMATVRAQMQQQHLQQSQQLSMGSMALPTLQAPQAGTSLGYSSAFQAASYGAGQHVMSQGLPTQLGASYPLPGQPGFQGAAGRHQALPQQIPGSMRDGDAQTHLDAYQLALLHNQGSLSRGQSLGQSLGGSLGYQPPDHAAAAASLAANAAFMQQQQLMSGTTGSYHTAHSHSSLMPVGSLEALRHGWQAPFGVRAQQQLLRQQLAQQPSLPGSSWEAPSWGSLGTTPTRSSGGMTLGSGLSGYPSFGPGSVGAQSQSARSSRRRSGGFPTPSSSRAASLQGNTLRQSLTGQPSGTGAQIDERNPFLGPPALSRRSASGEAPLGLMGNTPLGPYSTVPENMQWPQPQLTHTSPQLPNRTGTAASTPQTNMMLSPESHSSVPNPSDWDPSYSDDLLLSEDGQARRGTGDQRHPSLMQSARDLGSLDATSGSMMSTGSATFLQPSSQGPYDSVWQRSQFASASLPHSAFQDIAAYQDASGQSQFQPNLGNPHAYSGSLPGALRSDHLALLQASQQAQGYDPVSMQQLHQQHHSQLYPTLQALSMSQAPHNIPHGQAS